ncbi:NADP-dependent oxidoreductase [Dactylosporangium salmoneum]|uniref:NADP-dependent oxidoreductase n=1 Tax=Dactylosporangium salmoneum TaxID=53361 RepID=A0ABP5TM88_9ACTN
MRAVRYERIGGPEVLGVGEMEEPHAGPGEVRVRVRAAGISPVDVNLRAGHSPSAAGLRLPHVPGVDAAGVVDEVGEGADASEGDEVFGYVDVARLGGATAQYAVLRRWSARPASMPWAEAGAAGTGIETATRALDRLGVTAGATLLIDGAAGGVGSIAVQLAVARGARVLGTARPESHDFLAALGATPVPRLPTSLGPVDLALDVAGAGSLPELIRLTGTPAGVLTIADFSGPALGVPVSVGALGGEPEGTHGLAAAAVLHEQGLFRVPIQQVYAMSAAPQAHADFETGPRRGKLVIEVGPRLH